MSRNILLVDDQRDVLRLLHSTLDALKNDDVQIFEAPSGEEALLEASRNQIDLLVADYLLPGITGVELMHKIRARHPEAQVILISGVTDRKTRDVILSAGAAAIFDKPIPLADFLDVVERCLGLVRTIFPPEATDGKDEARQSRLSDLLANFRQDIDAKAVVLINERGRVLARAGDLYDSSMEVSLLAALIAIHAAGLKVSRYIRQETPNSYIVFRGGDHDLFFIPVTASYALLLAGNELANEDRMLETISSLVALRRQVEKAIKSLGVTSELKPLPMAETREPAKAKPQKAGAKEKPVAPEAAPAPEMEALLKTAANKKASQSDMDTFWDDAAEKHGSTPLKPDMISFEEARKLGFAPDEEK
ncbi:MAG: response regulator [Anaerolineales bacterium]|nr:response regulator [Anaerolineales bacterium]